ncbi:MAG TPA: aminoacetone oxidase family FAD-binding enzyme, partial [Ruminococcaceae bacterium]|nr:aminoacetone oxidase family FAD-binding enzyme [Oscillospiraceae bacterium]
MLKTTRGEVQFAEGALSGICIFDLSRAVGEAGGGAEISLNLAPEYGEEELA